MPHRVVDIGTGLVRRWRGRPNCDAMHAFLLDQLNAIHCSFLAPAAHLTQQQCGNLGEFIAFAVGWGKGFSEYDRQCANAYNPLSLISQPGIDIIWFRFADDPADDKVILQEVKTTRSPDMDIRHRLVDDYRKLFSGSSRRRLPVMLQAMKSRLIFEASRPDLAHRVTRMLGPSPQTCSGIMLAPTIVHEEIDSDPDAVMLAVRTSIGALG